MTRAEKVVEAQRLRTEGLLFREIAARMGVAIQTVDSWLNDPDGSRIRARKQSYGGTCIHCGGPTYGNDGPGSAPDCCGSCFAARNADRNSRIIEGWERGDTAPVIARREDVSAQAVMGVIETHRRRKGEPISLHRRRNRELWGLLERRWNEGIPVRAIAAEAGISPENAYFMLRAMRKAGIDLPERSVGARRRAAA